MTTAPRVVDASRPRLRVTVDAAEAAELLMSMSTLLGDHPPDEFDVGPERIAAAKAAIPAGLLELARDVGLGEGCSALLLGLVWETPAPRRVDDFLAHLRSLEPLELKLQLLGYYVRGHHVAEPETIRRAALGDEAAAGELVEAAGEWEEKGKFVERVLALDGSTLRSRLVDVVAAWNEAVFAPTLDEIRPLLERDAEEKRALAAALPPGEFIVRATGGIQYTAPPEIHDVVFFPTWWFRPWVFLSEHKNARIFGYSISASGGDGSVVDLGDLARLYKALGDEKRLALLELLRRGPLALGDAARTVGLSKSTAHHHLAILRQAGLVLIREDQEKSYTLRDDRVRDVARLLEGRL
jgi:DNA-binding transcriptional ArsR family regulator/sarcosine oxidase gamma subunit